VRIHATEKKQPHEWHAKYIGLDVHQATISDTTELVMESVLHDDPPDGEIFLSHVRR
jgi:hypothetical protein